MILGFQVKSRFPKPGWELQEEVETQGSFLLDVLESPGTLLLPNHLPSAFPEAYWLFRTRKSAKMSRLPSSILFLSFSLL
jgi:hypothetical protein